MKGWQPKSRGNATHDDGSTMHSDQMAPEIAGAAGVQSDVNPLKNQQTSTAQ